MNEQNELQLVLPLIINSCSNIDDTVLDNLNSILLNNYASLRTDKKRDKKNHKLNRDKRTFRYMEYYYYLKNRREELKNKYPSLKFRYSIEIQMIRNLTVSVNAKIRISELDYFKLLGIIFKHDYKTLNLGNDSGLEEFIQKFQTFKSEFTKYIAPFDYRVYKRVC